MIRLLFGKIIFILMFLSLSSTCFAETREFYTKDEKSGFDVPDEFKLKYQIPSEWLLPEKDDTDLFGARSSWRGNLALNYRYFYFEGLYPSQSRSDASLMIEPEYSLTWPEGNVFVFAPYAQLDSQDKERSHYDIRELYVMLVGDTYELSLGAKKIFWGVTESQNLVDIINQSDLVARGKSSDKLGQPMINLTLLQDWGTVDLFVLPYFRERTFTGKDGRLRSPLPIDTDRATYENSDEENHIDYAIRYSHYLGALEFGLSYFSGTARDPQIVGTDFILLPDGYAPTALIPYYHQMNQIGLDIQYILDSWLIKGEFVNRSTTSNDKYNAWTVGFEYTFTGVMRSEIDLSIMGEWLYDDRKEESTSPFNNDLMAGTRLAFNDINNSELTISVITDLDYSATVLSIEATRRLTDHWKLNLEIYRWWEKEQHDAFYYLRDDDLISCRFAYYF